MVLNIGKPILKDGLVIVLVVELSHLRGSVKEVDFNGIGGFLA